MEKVNTERSVYIGHGKNWVVTQPEAELSNEALQHEAECVAVGYDTGLMAGKTASRGYFVLGCTIGILIGTIVTGIVVSKYSKDSE